MVTLQDIKQNEAIKAMIRAGNRYLEALGYTDHGPRHVSYVSRTASGILNRAGIFAARGRAGGHCGMGARRGQQR